MKKTCAQQSGFTLVEAVVGSAVFLVIALAAYQGYATLLKGVELLQVKSDALALADEQIEVVRNLPYASVGTVGGVPAGLIPQTQTLVRDGITFSVGMVIRNVDDPFDGSASGTPQDTAPADYKLAEVSVACASCSSPNPVSLTTWIAPLNLEIASTSGSLFIKVFDANGQPVVGANINVQDASASPAINITDSTDQTYPVGALGNPNPTKPNATVAENTVTQTSFSIDKLGSMNVSTMDTSCNSIPSVPLSMQGSKTIGTSPTVYKYSQSFTTAANGTLVIPNLEWDSYSPTIGSSTYELVGSNPILPINLNAGTTQNVQFVLAPKNPDALLVTVVDSATGLPLSGATISITNGGASSTQTTGQGFLGQTDWSAGKYSSTDGNVDADSIPGQVQLHNAFGTYSSSGWLTSSTFDTGTSSNFNQISWLPQNQNPLTGTNSVKFQFASSGSSSPATWNYIGPDGTAATYYTTASPNISTVNDGDRYFRYKMYLSTVTATSTPIVSDVSVTYSLSCTPPGQVFWDGLAAGTYTVTVSASGYQTYTGSVNVSSAWQAQTVSLGQ